MWAIASSTSGSGLVSRTTRVTSSSPRRRASVSRSSEALRKGGPVSGSSMFVGVCELLLGALRRRCGALARRCSGGDGRPRRRCRGGTGARGGAGLRRHAVGDDRPPAHTARRTAASPGSACPGRAAARGRVHGDVHVAGRASGEQRADFGGIGPAPAHRTPAAFVSLRALPQDQPPVRAGRGRRPVGEGQRRPALVAAAGRRAAPGRLLAAVRDDVTEPDIIYVACGADGLWRSLDDGASFTRCRSRRRPRWR